jgi:hypothetical protein
MNIGGARREDKIRAPGPEARAAAAALTEQPAPRRRHAAGRPEASVTRSSTHVASYTDRRRP